MYFSRGLKKKNILEFAPSPFSLMPEQKFPDSDGGAEDLDHRKRHQQRYQSPVMAVVPGKFKPGLRSQRQPERLPDDKTTGGKPTTFPLPGKIRLYPMEPLSPFLDPDGSDHNGRQHTQYERTGHGHRALRHRTNKTTAAVITASDGGAGLHPCEMIHPDGNRRR